MTHNPTPILYTHAQCADSGRVCEWLASHGVVFIERDASSDDAAVAELIATGIVATPPLVVGDAMILGFRPKRFAEVFTAPSSDDELSSQVLPEPPCHGSNDTFI